MTARIRVLVVDDQTLVREGFRKLLELEPDFEVVGTVGDGEAAITAVERLHQAGTPPDVILMDVFMADMDGLEATEEIMHQTPTPIVIISGNVDEKDPPPR